MRKIFFLLFPVICIAVSNRIFAQTANISENQVKLLTYPFSDPNPIPMLGNIYPYFRIDGFSSDGAMRNWNMVEMENDYIKLWIVPEIGGKIWGAIEKSTGKEFIYYNHVVKFRDVAIRGPWTSGGIEMNFGVIGHAPTCSSPVDYITRKNKDGSVSCFVGAIDLPSHTRWSMEINLSKDKAYFTTRAIWDNPTVQEQSYYQWMNLGIKSAGNLEYVFPGNYYVGHDGKYFSWPVDEKGCKINFYDNNNFGNDKSYHVFGEASSFYGAYWHDDDFGFGHYSLYDEKPGKKIFIWGLSDAGKIWEKLLTDKDGQYTEIQSGRLFNQGEQASSTTPFKNRGFAPGLTDEWTEYWFPVKQTNGLKNALPIGSVNIRQQGDTIKLWFCPNENTDGKLEVRNGNEKIFVKEIHSAPMKVIIDKFEFKGSYYSLSIWFDNKMIYDANQEKYLIKRPVASPADFNWATASGHYMKGKENERQRLYNEAEQEYNNALKIEPWYVPALTGMANLAYRKTEFKSSLDYSLKALSIDTYDADANMVYGLSSLALEDTTSAIDGFSIASESASIRTAAYNALASIYLGKQDYNKALIYTEKSLNYNQLGSDATQLRILSLRKLKMQNEAITALNELEERDPLNHFIRIEKFLNDNSSQNEINVKRYISNELSYETYLEYSLWYFKNGQLSDALKVLELAPENHPIVLLFKGYLNHREGNEKLASAELEKALKINPQFVFPFRTETLKPLEWAQKLKDNWKLKYYTGLIYLHIGAEDKGRSEWNSCGDTPDFYPFYIARSQLADSGSQHAQLDIERALSLAGKDWQAGLFAAKFYLGKGNLLKALELDRNFYEKNPQNYYLGLHYAKVLELHKNYPESVNVLQKIRVLPNEGATAGRITWRNANIGKALDLMKEKKYRDALNCIDMARQWPANLGVGRPYKIDEHLEDFIAFQCYKKMNDNKSTEEMRKKIIGKTGHLSVSFDSNDFLTAWVLRETGQKSEGDKVMNDLVLKKPMSESIQWCYAVYLGEMERANVIAINAEKNDHFIFFLERLVTESLKLK